MKRNYAERWIFQIEICILPRVCAAAPSHAACCGDLWSLAADFRLVHQKCREMSELPLRGDPYLDSLAFKVTDLNSSVCKKDRAKQCAQLPVLTIPEKLELLNF